MTVIELLEKYPEIGKMTLEAFYPLAVLIILIVDAIYGVV